MVSNGVLIDTGPLVALLNERDEHHQKCVELANQICDPIYTTWPVITEAAYLLRDRPAAVDKLLTWVSSAEIHIYQLGLNDAKQMAKLLSRFSDQWFDLADASLMWLAEREEIETVFTIDYRDFSIFRTTKGRALVILSGGE